MACIRRPPKPKTYHPDAAALQMLKILIKRLNLRLPIYIFVILEPSLNRFNMNKFLIMSIATATGISMAACSSTAKQALAPKPFVIGESTAMPPAMVYKTNGDYFNNVPVTLNAERTEIVSFPAPTDITDASLPLRFAGGWLLDRRGVTENSAFLDYTYKEYRKLKQTPTSAELMEHIIPGSEVTEMRRLPIPLWKAIDDPVEASKLVDGSPVVFEK